MADYNLDLERHVLAAILADAGSFADVSFLAEKDFSPLHRAIFAVLKARVEKAEVLSSLLVAEALKSYGVSFENVQPYEYLESLSLISVKKTEVESLGKALKKKTVLRELTRKCDDLKAELKTAESKPFNDIVGMVDKTLAEIDTGYYHNETVNLMEGMIDKIEEEGNSPLEATGFLGPFPSVNLLLGPTIYRGSMTVLAARTGHQKSSLSWFYTTYIAEKYNVPVLILDAAEMTEEEIQYRAVCSMSKGVIPYHALERHIWRRNVQWLDAVRSEIWPRIRHLMKIGIYFKNIGGMTPQEIISYIRSFYYSKIGRGNFFIIDYDYLKGTNVFQKNMAEYQLIGNFVNDLKSLITNEIEAGAWVNVQKNRSGIYTGRGSEEMMDSDASVSLSDRIMQQATHGFTLRFKLPDELAQEENKYGNIRLGISKHRKLGEKYNDMIFPIKSADGKFRSNYVNLLSKGFYFSDMKSYKEMIEELGQAAVPLDENPEDKGLL